MTLNGVVMKSFSRMFAGMVVLAAIVTIVLWLGSHFFAWFATLPPTLQGPVAGACAVVLVPIVTYFSNRSLENKRTRENALREQKIALYDTFINRATTVLFLHDDEEPPTTTIEGGNDPAISRTHVDESPTPPASVTVDLTVATGHSGTTVPIEEIVVTPATSLDDDDSAIPPTEPEPTETPLDTANEPKRPLTPAARLAPVKKERDEHKKHQPEPRRIRGLRRAKAATRARAYAAANAPAEPELATNAASADSEIVLIEPITITVEPRDDFGRIFNELTPRLITYASRDVIVAAGQLRKIATAGHSPVAALVAFENLLRAMRADLGYPVFNHAKGELLQLFVENLDSLKRPVPPPSAFMF
ncbi:MAG: hypothetical protein LBM23_01015 [Propionibacteriaceae bacterium]|jgi:hypothetical protein|nr:hypothetical protein [Propionibacteriaceae bacterium]